MCPGIALSCLMKSSDNPRRFQVTGMMPAEAFSKRLHVRVYRGCFDLESLRIFGSLNSVPFSPEMCELELLELWGPFPRHGGDPPRDLNVDEHVSPGFLRRAPTSTGGGSS